LANYLSTIRDVSNAVKVGQDFDVSGKALSRAGENAGFAALTALASGRDPLSAAAGSLSSIPGVPTALRAVNSLTGGALGLGGLTGSKPKALHTEYAKGEANWQKPYGVGTDVVFYLMRADGGSEGGSASGFNESSGKVAANVQAGPGLPSNLQSPLNQIAAATKMAGVDSNNTVSPGLAGPLSGLDQDLSVRLGSTSQAAALLESSPSLVRNAVRSADAFSNFSPLSIPSSETFFSTTLNNSFNPDAALGALRSAEEIALTADRVPVTELSFQLAKATKGVTSTSDLIEGINYGRFAYSTQKARASANRIGPQGLSQRKGA